MSTPVNDAPPSSPACAESKQGSHQFVLTLHIASRGARTYHGTYTPDSGQTRHDVYRHIRKTAAADDGDPRWLTAQVLFFSLEPNQL